LVWGFGYVPPIASTSPPLTWALTALQCPSFSPSFFDHFDTIVVIRHRWFPRAKLPARQLIPKHLVSRFEVSQIPHPTMAGPTDKQRLHQRVDFMTRIISAASLLPCL
ncbi:unnamed protein product, partial [Ectocarpus sp. 13 AM-2016]